MTIYSVIFRRLTFFILCLFLVLLGCGFFPTTVVGRDTPPVRSAGFENTGLNLGVDANYWLKMKRGGAIWKEGDTRCHLFEKRWPGRFAYPSRADFKGQFSAWNQK